MRDRARSGLAQDALDGRRRRGGAGNRMRAQRVERAIDVTERELSARGEHESSVVVARSGQRMLTEAGEHAPCRGFGRAERLLRERDDRRRKRDARAVAEHEEVLAELVDRLSGTSTERVEYLVLVERSFGGGQEREQLAPRALRACLDGVAQCVGGVRLDARQRGLGERDLQEEWVAARGIGEVVGERAPSLRFERAHEAHRVAARERKDLVRGRAECGLARGDEPTRDEHEARLALVGREPADDVAERRGALVEVVPDDRARRGREEHGERVGDAIGRRRRARLADCLGGSLDGVARVGGPREGHVHDGGNGAVASSIAAGREHERRLADAGRAVDENDAAARHERAQLRELALATDQKGAASVVHQ